VHAKLASWSRWGFFVAVLSVALIGALETML
jgi:hypothetical protein